MPLQKNRKKSRFWIFKKNVKYVFSNYADDDDADDDGGAVDVLV